MFKRFLSRLKTLLKGHRFRSELDEEMAFHMDLLTQDLIRQGMEPGEARRQARIRFGNQEGVRARSREARGLALFDEMGRNLRFALRGLARSPVFAGTFILTLALCIGLGTAVFSVVDAVLWRPLPYPHPEKLAHAVLYSPAHGKSPGNTAVDGRSWERIRDQADGFQRAVYSGWYAGVNLTTDATAAFVQQQRVGAGYFRTLGVLPKLGREFEVPEDLPGGHPVAILSHHLWTRTFDGDPAILGRTIQLKGEAHTVVGIMPDDFQGQARADVWTPLRPSTTGEGGGTNYAVLVRVPEAMTLQEAEARFAAMEAPQSDRPDAPERRFGLVPLDETLTAGLRLPLLILLGAIGVMLVVGCANLAGLQIARSLARRTELATRQALGSGSGALVRQMLAENLLLGLLGGAAGLGVTVLAMGGLEALVQSHFHIWQEVRLDGRALGVALGLSALATLLFGMAPLLQATRTDLQRVLVTGSRSLMGAGGHGLRKLLLVGEVAMVTALLFSAGLLVRSYGYLEGLDPGFDPDGVLTVQLSLDDARYAEAEDIQRLFRETRAAIQAVPGVASTSVALTLPYERPLNLGFRFMGEAQDVYHLTNAVYVTPGFFETLDIPLLQGRDLDEGDRWGAPFVAVANQAWVDNYLEGRPALGSRILMGFAGGDGLEIVGVAGSVLQQAGWGENPDPVWGTPTLYLSAAQAGDAFMQQIHVWFSPSWIVRGRDAGQELALPVTRAIQAVDPGLPVARVSLMEEVMDETFARSRFEALFLVVVSGFALLLAGIGLYGIVAHEVIERRAEMGLRMALGATPGNAVWKTGAGGLRLTLLGLALGGALSVAVGRVMVHLLYGVTAFDPLTLLVLVGILGLFACIASFAPAAHMGRLSPATILREG
jgi:predicted permease